MTSPFLRAAWVMPAHGDAAAVGAYADAVAATTGRPTAAYVLQPKTPVMKDITSRLDHMDEHRYRTLPTHLVLAAIETLDDGLEVEPELAKLAGKVSVVVSGLYTDVARIDGALGPPADSFAPAVQLGTFAMRSAAGEWAVSEWYRTRRLPSFGRIDGGHRARRFVSVCGGPAKLAVLYEFRSLDDRREHFEPLETVDHDEDSPTAATRTVHPPFSPSVGALLPR